MANTKNSGITISTTDSLTTGQKIMIGNAMMAFEPAAPSPSLVMNVDMPDGHKQFDLLTYARLDQAVALQEGVDLSVTQQLFANAISVNPTEHGVIVTISTRAMRRQPESLEGQSGGQMGVALREREDRDILALFSGFSEDAGSATTTLDITFLRGSIAFLRTDNDSEFGPAPNPIRGILHAEHISDVVADLTQGSAASITRTAATTALTDGVSAEIMRQWWRGSDRAYGIQLFEDGYMTRDSGDDAIGAFLNENALALVLEGNDEPTREEDGSARLVEFGLFKSWGETERADPHGLAATFDAAKTI